MGGEQEENLLLETKLDFPFQLQLYDCGTKVSFTKLQKFHSQDNTHADAFALSSVRTFSPVLTLDPEDFS